MNNLKMFSQVFSQKLDGLMSDENKTSKLNLLNAFNNTTTNHSGVCFYKKILPTLATVMFVATVAFSSYFANAQDIEPFSNEKGKWGFIDKTGKVILGSRR